MVVDQAVISYVEKNVFPLYSRNEKGHGIEHIKAVIEKSLKLATKLDVNMNMVYVTAAYHDLGHFQDPKKHEILSAKMFIEDEGIKEFFDEEQLITIKEAIEDHRASSDHMPRSIYGKIVSTADRGNQSADERIRRSYHYGKRNYPNLTEEEQVLRIYEHLKEKFGEDGYAKVYLEDEEYDRCLLEFRNELKNKEEFIKKIVKVIGNESNIG